MTASGPASWRPAPPGMAAAGATSSFGLILAKDRLPPRRRPISWLGCGSPAPSPRRERGELGQGRVRAALAALLGRPLPRRGAAPTPILDLTGPLRQARNQWSRFARHLALP